MKTALRSIALAALVAPGVAQAQTQTIRQVIPFDYNPAIDAAFPEIQRFDTLGGTRELVGVTLSYDQSISFGVRLEQNSPVAIEDGNFFADVVYLSIHQLGFDDGSGGDDDNEGPPFLGPGAAGDVFSGPLGPTDGFNASGPDSYTAIFDSGEFNFTATADRSTAPAVLDTLTGEGSLTTLLAGFVEIFGGYNTDPGFPEVDPNNPPEGPFFPFQDPFYGVFVDVFDIRHQGTITATFEYTIVPAPASVACVGLAGLAAVRRRR